MSFFVDCGDGVEIYDTEHEAKEAAQKALEGWRECCDPEWPEEVERVCWGEIRECVVPVPKGENDEYVDYELMDNRETM